MLSKFKLNQLYFKDTQFANLMTRRIFNVLLIANPYDAFMLEDDGRIDEKIFNEYTSLSLRYPPRFTQVSSCEEALEHLGNLSYDLIICMPGTGDNEGFGVARHIKAEYPQIPMVILTPFSHGITERIAHEDLSPFEYVFCWLGNTDLLVSIIKLIEDKMNLEHDVNEVGVQLILLVEDSIRFYSSILPNLYKFVLKQSQEFSTEALNTASTRTTYWASSPTCAFPWPTVERRTGWRASSYVPPSARKTPSCRSLSSPARRRTPPMPPSTRQLSLTRVRRRWMST